MDSLLADLSLLSAAWIVYFAVHSFLASLTLKRWVAQHYPSAMPRYRLAFNVAATIGILPIAWLFYAHPGPVLWTWSGWQAWLANGLAAAAVAGFFVSLRHYDTGEFLGLRQLRESVTAVEDQEAFHLSPFHRHVRHPWYFFSLVILWTRDMNAAMAVSALLLTAYLAVGSLLEERKLLAYHGERYRRYRERVPGLIPLPWKRLTAQEAEEIAGG